VITAIEIENFKGVRERVRIEIRPLTLLFGANSAGKSTFLHALHYAREIFQRHNVDADKTIAGGAFVDLGGFRNFIHRGTTPGRLPPAKQHGGSDAGYGGTGDGSGTGMGTGYGNGLPNGSGYGDSIGRGESSADSIANRSIHLRFDLDLRDVNLPEFLPSREEINRNDVPLPDLSVGVQAASIELLLSWSEFFNTAYVAGYYVGINGEPLASIMCDAERAWSVYIDFINHEHPIFQPGFAEDVEPDLPPNWSWMHHWYSQVFDESPDQMPMLPIDGQRDALPEWEKFLGLVLDDSSESSESASSPHDTSFEKTMFLSFLSQLIVGPGQLLRDELAKLRYLGPVRQTPERRFEPPRYPDPSRWASGLGAWDLLYTADEALVRNVGQWLGDSDRLNAGYRIERRQYKELDLGDPLLLQLLTGRAFEQLEYSARLDMQNIPTRSRLVLVASQSAVELQPHDVGVGISQLVPVVVAAVDKSCPLVGIEQPELHIHPRLQAELGDLFLEAAAEDGRVFLLETHSEHLMLRLLRRIRETTEGELPEASSGLRPDQVAVFYVDNNDGQVRVTPLRIEPTGEFLDRWPKGFFDERAAELF
jgi:hypothetical protein